AEHRDQVRHLAGGAVHVGERFTDRPQEGGLCHGQAVDRLLPGRRLSRHQPRASASRIAHSTTIDRLTNARSPSWTKGSVSTLKGARVAHFLLSAFFTRASKEFSVTSISYGPARPCCSV